MHYKEMVKVLLVDVDSKMPNLALMKLSAYYKARGDEVGFNVSDPDIIYASVLFTKNKHKVDGLRFFYPDAKIIIGGTGYDLKLKLPDEIEFLKPDYDLYPDMEYSLGFTTRGCIRNCHFCLVPQKEGKLTRWQHPKDFHDDRFDTIMLLDNNWLADREWFFETSGWILGHDLAILEHGLDIRLLDGDICKRLRELKTIKGYHFAFDYVELEPVIREKIKLLEDYGFNLRQEIQFYIYTDSDKDFESALYRCNVLKELGTNPFVMFNPESKRNKRIKDLQRWANRKWLFWSCDFYDYHKKR